MNPPNSASCARANYSGSQRKRGCTQHAQSQMRCHGVFDLSWWNTEFLASRAKSASSYAFPLLACTILFELAIKKRTPPNREIIPFWEKKGQTHTYKRYVFYVSGKSPNLNTLKPQPKAKILVSLLGTRLPIEVKK